MLKVDPDGPVLRLTLNRPEVRNAFDEALIEALHEVFISLPQGTRAVVLGGAGEAFCAGADLQWMRRAAEYSREQNYEDALRLAKLFRAVVDCPAVVVAQVHGHAFGGGCGLVAAADVAVASDNVLFAFSEVKLGLVPATISPFVVPKIGMGHARALFSTGEAFSSQRALQIGLVHELVSVAELDRAVDRKVKAILQAGPSAASNAKQLAMAPPETLEEAALLLAQVRAGDEAREGVSAFLEKRKASFVGGR
jgi:enoyl-CoA hydratase/carnithine racemase